MSGSPSLCSCTQKCWFAGCDTLGKDLDPSLQAQSPAYSLQLEKYFNLISPLAVSYEDSEGKTHLKDLFHFSFST